MRAAERSAGLLESAVADLGRPAQLESGGHLTQTFDHFRRFGTPVRIFLEQGLGQPPELDRHVDVKLVEGFDLGVDRVDQRQVQIREGYSVERGERFGMIKFGSRVDVLFPLTAEIMVKLNQKVKGNTDARMISVRKMLQITGLFSDMQMYC